MNKQMKLALATGVLAAIIAQPSTAQTHMEPKVGDKMEKCYGVAKKAKNDCSSKANKHGCMGMSPKDGDPNEWVLLPKGTCDKLVGGALKPASEG